MSPLGSLEGSAISTGFGEDGRKEVVQRRSHNSVHDRELGNVEEQFLTVRRSSRSVPKPDFRALENGGVLEEEEEGSVMFEMDDEVKRECDATKVLKVEKMQQAMVNDSDNSVQRQIAQPGGLLEKKKHRKCSSSHTSRGKRRQNAKKPGVLEELEYMAKKLEEEVQMLTRNVNIYRVKLQGLRTDASGNRV